MLRIVEMRILKAWMIMGSREGCVHAVWNLLRLDNHNMPTSSIPVKESHSSSVDERMRCIIFCSRFRSSILYVFPHLQSDQITRWLLNHRRLSLLNIFLFDVLSFAERRKDANGAGTEKGHGRPAKRGDTKWRSAPNTLRAAMTCSSSSTTPTSSPSF